MRSSPSSIPPEAGSFTRPTSAVEVTTARLASRSTVPATSTSAEPRARRTFRRCIRFRPAGWAVRTDSWPSSRRAVMPSSIRRASEAAVWIRFTRSRLTRRATPTRRARHVHPIYRRSMPFRTYCVLPRAMASSQSFRRRATRSFIRPSWAVAPLTRRTGLPWTRLATHTLPARRSRRTSRLSTRFNSRWRTRAPMLSSRGCPPRGTHSRTRPTSVAPVIPHSRFTTGDTTSRSIPPGTPTSQDLRPRQTSRRSTRSSPPLEGAARRRWTDSCSSSRLAFLHPRRQSPTRAPIKASPKGRR